jgi:ADP-heptose:LPS heptosyltransferase
MRSPRNAPDVVVLRALGLGDLLTAVPALRGLRRAFARDRIELTTSAAVADLARWLRVADDVVPGDLDERPAATKPRVAVNLHGSGPESHRWLLATTPASLIAFAHPEITASSGGPAWRSDEHEVLRWCRLVASAGIQTDERDLSIQAPPDPLRTDVARVVVHVGAASLARRWPPDRWALLTRRLVRAGLDPVLTGSAEERPAASHVCARAGLPPERVLAGRTSILELAGIVGGARLVLAADTGVGHLATALGRPSVLLFGPTPPSAWGPPVDGPHTVLWKGTTGDPHGGEPDRGLLRITVDDVERAAATLL